MSEYSPNELNQITTGKETAPTFPSDSAIETNGADKTAPSNLLDIKTKSILNAPVLRGVPAEHEHWRGKIIPYGYRLTDLPGGLLKTSEEKPNGDLFAGPIFVLAQTSGPDGGDGGLVLELQNKRGKFITMSIPRARLHEEPRLLAQDLACQNFYILPGKEKELLIYLAKSEPIEDRISVTQTGWARSDDPEKLVYVLPDSSTEPGYHFQPERYSPTAISVRSAGILQEWVDNVFDYNAYPLFAVLVALSGPLIKAAGIDSGGFHFWGRSTSGKTTLAQISASVFGNGADPADAPSNPYVKRWNATLNAMEGLAAGHNDMPLILDELGSCNARDYGRAIYDLSGGQGKSAMDASRNLRKQRSWRISILSTGEVSSQTKVEEAISAFRTGRGAAKAGQLIRLIDIEIKPNIFSSREQVDKIKRSCAQYYGTLGPAYINEIIKLVSKSSDLRATVQFALDSALARLIARVGKVNPIQERALRRFALAEAAGYLLVRMHLIPGLTSNTIRDAIGIVVDDWMPQSEGLTDEERAIVAVREFILKYRDSRFKKIRTTMELLATDEKEKIYIAGYYDETRVDKAFFLLPETLREATGMDARSVAVALKTRGYLLLEQTDRYTYRIRLEDQRIATYAIKASLLGEG